MPPFKMIPRSPALLTIVNIFCLYQVYNNETFFIAISFPWFKFDLSGER